MYHQLRMGASNLKRAELIYVQPQTKDTQILLELKLLMNKDGDSTGEGSLWRCHGMRKNPLKEGKKKKNNNI